MITTTEFASLGSVPVGSLSRRSGSYFLLAYPAWCFVYCLSGVPVKVQRNGLAKVSLK